MPITESQKKTAEAKQIAAAQDNTAQIRLIAGPGTGKSRTIEFRVSKLLDSGANPEKIFIISFTRATCAELSERIHQHLSDGPHSELAKQITVSTMHSLALRILRKANLLNRYPAEPVILDNWELKKIYDREFSTHNRCTPTQASIIRRAYDANLQTLDAEYLTESLIQKRDIRSFKTFHGVRSNLYCCVLPGEVIFQCVENFNLGSISPSVLDIDHLIVDEYQDLNACDQEFVRWLCQNGAILFVAGDDDQSIYTSLRYAKPSGIVHFEDQYPESATHILHDCFRCTPNILEPATSLIQYNPDRQAKNLRALYREADPPVHGKLFVWSFTSPQQEAQAIAESCQQLIQVGMKGQEDEILILLSRLNPSSVQLDPITQELGNLGLPFHEPSGQALTEDKSLRTIYTLLRILQDRTSDSEDYPAYRDLLELLAGVGQGTISEIAQLCIQNAGNFRTLFHLDRLPSWLRGRSASAVRRVANIGKILESWSLSDTIADRLIDLGNLLTDHIFNKIGQHANYLGTWVNFASELPQDMSLKELHEYFRANPDEREYVLDRVNKRLGTIEISDGESDQKAIRISTMHGAKGLSAKVVFIPSVSQGIIPSFRSLRSAGSVIEQRRLFYVSVTRARAACIISHSSHYRGAPAQALQQRSSVRLSRSHFLNEMNVRSISRTGGLTNQEVISIMEDIHNL